MRKLRVAGLSERDEHMVTLQRLIASAEAQADQLKAAGGAPTMVPPDGAGVDSSPGGGADEESDSYSSCIVS